MRQPSKLILLLLLLSVPVNSFANPVGGSVSAGQAIISENATTLSVNQSTDKAVIDWRSFNINANETTQFQQPTSSSLTLNRINDVNPSQILGTLSANGRVILVNPNGVFFGPGSSVDVAGLIASTANISNNDFMSGKLHFNKPGNPDASIVNQGTITAKQAGLVGLVAPNVENDGVINATLGKVTLASGDTFTLDMAGDKFIQVAVSSDLQEQMVKNTGTITANGGKVKLTAAAARGVVNSLVSNTGVIQANAFAQKNGEIELFAAGSNAVPHNLVASKGVKSGTSVVSNSGTLSASGYGAGQKGGTIKVLGDKVNILSGSVIDASGSTGGGTILIGGNTHGAGKTPTALTTTVASGAIILANATGTGNGGNVTVWSDELTQFYGSITATGGRGGGNGGAVETSGKQLLDFAGTVNLTAPLGTTGTLLLDPENVTIGNNTSVTDTCSSGTCTPTADTSYLNVGTLNTALGTSSVTVTTGSTGSQTGNIVVSGTADSGGAAAISWSTSNLLTLAAAGNITIDAGATITNTYNSTFANTTTGNAIPVLLALRADSASAKGQSTLAANSYGVTNNGTINFSGSTGAVSLFNDWNFVAVNGTETANGSFAAPANASVGASQFTTYLLINSAADLLAVNTNATTLGYTYALGTNINGAAAAFNSNTPLGTFTGVLDGQYGTLAGGSNYGITNYTLTSNVTTGVGLFGTNSGVIRNLGIGLTVSDTYAGTVQQNEGTLAGSNGGTIANVTAASSGSVAYINTDSGGNGNSAYVGGLVGQTTGGKIINSTAADNVTFTYQGTSTSNGSIAAVGGLVGVNSSTTANSVSGSSASGTVTGQYGACSNGCALSGYFGGLIGLNGNTTNINTSTTGNSATGNVTSSIFGGTQVVGGLIGYQYSTSANATVNSNYTTGTISYTGASLSTDNVYIGGLIGENRNGGILGTAGSPNTYSYASVPVSYTGTSTPAILYIGGLAGYTNNTPLNYVYSSGNVSYSGDAATAYVGGLVGYNSTSNTTITNVTQTGTVNATQTGTATATIDVGGLVGANVGGVITYAASQPVTYTYQATGGTDTVNIGGLIGYNNSAIATSVTGSSSSGAVMASYSQTACSGGPCTGTVNGNIGGLIGKNSSTSTVSSDSATSNVSSTLTGTGENIGGLIGYNSDSSTTAIVNSSYTTGTISYTGTSATTLYIGGLVGYNSAGTITGANGSYSFATAPVSYTGSLSPYIGGLVGYNQGTINQAYATGNVSYSGTGSPGVGGLVGDNLGTISNSYTQTGTVMGTSTISGAATNGMNIGGLVGLEGTASIITGSTAAENVTYTYGGSSSASSGIGVSIGGLIGSNTSTATVSVTGSSAGGIVTAQYSTNGCTGGTACTGIVGSAVGGLIGADGNNVAVSIASDYATGNVNDSLSGGLQENVGGLVGNNYSTSATSIVSSYYTTGTVSYTGTSVGYVGGLVGLNQTGAYIINSYATGAVSVPSGNSSSYIGGLVGFNSGATSTIEGTGSSSSYATGNVSYSGTGVPLIGGLVGDNSGAITQTYTQTGTVMATNTISSGTNTFDVGGLVGQNTGTITNSTASESPTYTYSGSSGSTVNAYVGGLIGYNNSTATTSVSGSSASGTVTAQNSGCSSNCAVTGYVGGLIGQSGSNGATSTSGNFATGNVSSSLGGGSEYIGGLMGISQSTSTSAVINSYYTTGTISYTGSAPTTLGIGGLVGWNSNGTIGGTGSSYSYATAPVSYSGSATPSNFYLGGLVGNNAGTINQAYATGNVSYMGAGSPLLGGLVGLNSGTISNSYTNTGTVSATSTIASAAVFTIDEGGIAGSSTSGTVTGSSSSEPVTFTYSGSSSGTTSNAYIGGLIGQNGSTATTSVSGSSASGAVSAQNSGCSNGCVVNGYIGGLIGQMGTTAVATSTNFASGNVSSGLSGGSEDIGGLVGYDHSTSASSIMNSYATGAVSYTGTTTATNIGGLVGLNPSGSTITNTYAIGDIIAGVATSHGGLVGSNAGTITTSYYDSYTTGQSDTGKGTSQITSQLQGTLPSGFSNSIWGITTSSYPYLLAQLTPGTITAQSGTPQVVSGIVYSDHGVTLSAGVSVGALINGSSAASLLGATASSGNNGYYYFLLAPSTLSGTGSELLMYLTGTTKGNTLDDGANGSVTALNIYGSALRLVSATGTPVSVTTGLTTAQGSNTGANFIGTASTANGIDLISTASGDIELVSSVSWSSNTPFILSAYRNIYIDSGVTITNTYPSTFANTTTGNAVPVLLALRADNTGIDAGYGVTGTSSTINFGSSTGAVSIFNDSSFAVANGTQTQNGSWAVPANASVSTQFTTYKLVNSVADLAGISLSGTYALGQNINGGAAAFNSNTPLGTFNGILDGQYGTLIGGSNYGVTNLTMTSADNNGVGIFESNNGLIRNLSIGLTVSETYNGTASPLTEGTIAGTNTTGGTLANVTAASSGSVTYINTDSGTNSTSDRVGGLVGTNTGIIINSTAADNVTFTYQGSSSTSGTASVGRAGGLQW